MTELKTHVDKLVEKAASTEKSEDAVRFSQAALNAAHTKHALAEMEKPKD